MCQPAVRGSSGRRSGKYNAAAPPERGRAKEGAAKVERNLTIAEAVIETASQIGCTASQVAIAWIRSRPGVIIPLIGARNVSQLDDDLGASSVTLSDEQLAKLESVSVIDLGFPHDFLHADNVKDLMYAGTRNDMDIHRT